MLQKKFNIISLLLASAICIALTIAVYSFKNHEATVIEPPQAIKANSEPPCQTVSHRLAGYTFVKPLLYNSQLCESSHYNGLKKSIEEAINGYKEAGIVDQTSVFFKNLNNREYISINETAAYHPASLIKLPLLMTYLRMEELKPGFLDIKILCELPKGQIPSQTYNTKNIVPGKSYSIRELLKYMVAYSDNNATYLLNVNCDWNVFKRMYYDFGLSIPDEHDLNYQVTAKDYSIFLNVIYNAGYLTIPHSEFVAELLNESDFNIGIKGGLEDNVKLVHKFGEWGTKTDPNIHQLSESAIVYLDKSPYLITIMTQGKNVKRLPEVISGISRIVYNNEKKEATTPVY